MTHLGSCSPLIHGGTACRMGCVLFSPILQALSIALFYLGLLIVPPLYTSPLAVSHT